MPAVMALPLVLSAQGSNVIDGNWLVSNARKAANLVRGQMSSSRDIVKQSLTRKT